MGERNLDIKINVASYKLGDGGWHGRLAIATPEMKTPLLFTAVVPADVAHRAARAWCGTVNDCLQMQRAVVSGHGPAANYYAWRTHHGMGQSAQEIAAAAQAIAPLVQQGLPMVTGLLRDVGEGVVNLFKGGPTPGSTPVQQNAPAGTGAFAYFPNIAEQIKAGVDAGVAAQQQGASPEQAQQIARQAQQAVKDQYEAGQARLWEEYRRTNGAPPPSSLPGAGLGLYGAGNNAPSAPQPAPMLGTGQLLKTALDTAVDSPGAFGRMAPEVANLLSTSLHLYDRAVLSKLGTGDYQGAIREAHDQTARKVANALRMVKTLMEM